MEWFTIFIALNTKQKFNTCLFLVLTCLPKTLLYGTEVSRAPYTVGKRARYVCNPGYALVGCSVLKCVKKICEAGWNEDFPICVTRVRFKKPCNELTEESVLRYGKYTCGKVSFFVLNISLPSNAHSFWISVKLNLELERNFEWCKKIAAMWLLWQIMMLYFTELFSARYRILWTLNFGKRIQKPDWRYWHKKYWYHQTQSGFETYAKILMQFREIVIQRNSALI